MLIFGGFLQNNVQTAAYTVVLKPGRLVKHFELVRPGIGRFKSSLKKEALIDLLLLLPATLV